MVYFAQIKLGADILLVISMIFLCYRLLASGSLSGKTSQLMLLEASLKGLVKDADGASRALNDELQRRQNALERVLHDFEGREKRLVSMQETASRQLQEVEARSRHAQELFAKLSQIKPKQPMRPVEDAPEPPSFQVPQPRAEVERHKLPERRTQRTRLSEKIERAVLPAAEAVEQTAQEVSQIIEVAEEASDELSKEANDTRLGVLGTMRRQTQTL